MASFTTILHYKIFILRQFLRRLRRQAKERLIASMFFRYLSRLLLPRVNRYRPAMCDSLLNAESADADIGIVKDHLERTIDTISDSKTITSAMEQALRIGDRDLTLRIHESAIRRGIRLSRSERKLAELTRRNYREYFKSYVRTPKKKWVKKFFPEKFVPTAEISTVLYGSEKVGILTTLGPGDEIAFSTTYAALLEDSRIDPARFRILCDHRLHPLLERSFPSLEFIPSRRSRNITPDNPWWLYDKLPDFGMHVLMCNNSMEKMMECDKFLYMHDLLYHYCDYMLQTSHQKLFRPDPEKVKYYRKLLPRASLLVGLIWRSTVLTYKRNQHYLWVDELSPLFEVDDTVFVNLQYGLTRDELDFINTKWPGRFISLPELDLYNDFDSAAALIDCLDLVISPATVMGTLAAQTGKPVLLIANTLEVTLRCRDDGRDVWHPNLHQVHGDRLNDKASLVKNIAALLHQTKQNKL